MNTGIFLRSALPPPQHKSNFYKQTIQNKVHLNTSRGVGPRAGLSSRGNVEAALREEGNLQLQAVQQIGIFFIYPTIQHIIVHNVQSIQARRLLEGCKPEVKG